MGIELDFEGDTFVSGVKFWRAIVMAFGWQFVEIFDDEEHLLRSACLRWW